MVKRVVVIPAGPPKGDAEKREHQRRMGLGRRIADRRHDRHAASAESDRRARRDRRGVADRRKQVERRIGLNIGSVLAEIEF